MEFGGVHEEEEEAGFVATFVASFSALHWLQHGSIQGFVAEECVAPVISCQKDMEVWQNLWSASPWFFFETNLKRIHEHFDDRWWNEDHCVAKPEHVGDIVQQKVLDCICKRLWTMDIYGISWKC